MGADNGGIDDSKKRERKRDERTLNRENKTLTPRQSGAQAFSLQFATNFNGGI